MFPCLSAAVGLRGLLPEPAGGFAYYVNDLPGLSTELAQNLLNDDEQGLAVFWATVQRRAALRLLGGLEQGLTAARDWTRIVGQTGRPAPVAPRNLVAPPAGLTGTIVSVPDPVRLVLKLERVFVFVEGAQPVRFAFHCLDMGDGEPATLQTPDGLPMLAADALTLDPGLNELLIEAVLVPRYGEAALFVGFDTSLDLLTGQAPACRLLEFAYPEGLGNGLGLTPAQLDGEDWTQYVSWDYLVHAQVSAECSSERLLCQYASLFTEAWLNLLGLEILREKLHSDNANWFTLSNLTQTQANADDLLGFYRAALAQALKRLPVDVACTYCDPEQGGQITYNTDEMP